MEFFNVCDATRMPTNGHEFSINIYETFLRPFGGKRQSRAYGHLCDAVGKGNTAS